MVFTVDSQQVCRFTVDSQQVGRFTVIRLVDWLLTQLPCNFSTVAVALCSKKYQHIKFSDNIKNCVSRLSVSPCRKKISRITFSNNIFVVVKIQPHNGVLGQSPRNKNKANNWCWVKTLKKMKTHLSLKGLHPGKESMYIIMDFVQGGVLAACS